MVPGFISEGFNNGEWFLNLLREVSTVEMVPVIILVGFSKGEVCLDPSREISAAVNSNSLGHHGRSR